MNKIYKILGKRGRITIPFEMRMRMGFAYNDVLSFIEQDDNTVVVKREKICDSSCSADVIDDDKNTAAITLLEFLDGLTADEQRAALIHLSLTISKLSKGGVKE